MATATSSLDPAAATLRRRGRFSVGDAVLYGITLAAALSAIVLLLLIAREILVDAWPAMEEFGLGFVTSKVWNPTANVFGAAPFLFGTALTSFGALLIAGPISIAIALFLTELAPRWLRGPIGALVEMLASVPSVVLGLWGILVMGPWIVDHVGPFLHRTLGWTPFFKTAPAAGSSFLSAILILTIMMVPIISSICRELFLNVPRDLKEGALALGATRWELVKGVIFPYARAGIAAAMILGLGRAVGEAIAVTQVIGNNEAITWNLFDPGDTLASRIASSYQGATTDLMISSLVYLAVILLAFSLVVNLLARVIITRVGARHQGRA
ncbi:MAG TPA: phosphate ABC transporter permease subunit PstC [Gaiellaceae bacterium]